jgi:hypothetical protein
LRTRRLSITDLQFAAALVPSLAPTKTMAPSASDLTGILQAKLAGSALPTSIFAKRASHYLQ